MILKKIQVSSWSQDGQNIGRVEDAQTSSDRILDQSDLLLCFPHPTYIPSRQLVHISLDTTRRVDE